MQTLKSSELFTISLVYLSEVPMRTLCLVLYIFGFLYALCNNHDTVLTVLMLPVWYDVCELLQVA